MDTFTLPTLPSLGIQRLTDAVYRTLREQILAQAFPPGHRLDIGALAKQLGTSRTPLKDALNILASEGLVEIVPRKGTFIAGMSDKDVEEAFDVRRALESLAAELLIERITTEALSQLRSQLAALEEAAKEGDTQKHMKENMIFHKRFVEFAGSRRLLEHYEALDAHIQIARAHARNTNWRHRLGQERAEHEEILAALEARDGPRLVAAVSAHIQRGKHAVLDDVRISTMRTPEDSKQVFS